MNKNVLDDVLNLVNENRHNNDNDMRFYRLVTVLFDTFTEVNRAVVKVDADYGITLLLNQVLRLNVEFAPTYHKKLHKIIMSYVTPTYTA